jgi:predicted oxidoreductase (fatty acid repression mutant protein)
MDVQTALSNLYQASRLALLTADQHDKLRESAEALHAHINSDATETTSEMEHAQES